MCFSKEIQDSYYETIEKMCDRDTILTAQEAVDYGFVDSIVMNKK